MNESETISWIFLATAFASEQEPANFESISQIADGINHAVPTHKELQTSINWLTSAGMVEKQGKKYKLTNVGSEKIKLVEARTNNIITNIWDELTKEIENTKAQQ
jgi:predicted transcriptional regulator